MEKGQLPGLPCEAKQAGRLQPFAGKELRLAVCQLQHDVNGLQIALVYRVLAAADHIPLKPHQIRYRSELAEHSIHSVLRDLHALRTVMLHRERIKLAQADVLDLLEHGKDVFLLYG